MPVELEQPERNNAMDNLVEVLTPKQDSQDLDKDLETFATKYRRALDEGFGLSLPDNPMGRLHFQATEVLPELGLPVPPGKALLHLNTFHTKEHLDGILKTAGEIGITHILVVSGDGSERLPKLKPEDIGMSVNSVTSVELIQYINARHPNAFTLGVAFNPYEPLDHEIHKMERKIAAGARFIITQPIIERHQALEELRRFNTPVMLEAWMSKRIDLLAQCIGYDLPQNQAYDPLQNLRTLRANYPDSKMYLALVGFKTQIPEIKNILGMQ